MKYTNKFLLLLATLMMTGWAFGQSARDLRINEIQIKNTDNFVDEYGRHVPWIEIFNSSYNTVNIAGCYLTDDTTGFSAVKSNGIPAHWYQISKTDVNTSIQQRSYAVFYLDAQPLYGTFHTNFDPRTSKTNYIALISGDGKDVIHILQYPKEELMDTCLSYGADQDASLKKDNKDKAKKKNMMSEYQFKENPTPGFSNELTTTKSRQEKLKEDDPYGIGLALISMSVVFTALIIIYIMLKLFGYLSRKAAAKNSPQTETESGTADSTAPTAKVEHEMITGEELAAISTALHLHFNSMHDEESEIITIDMPSAHYSPWAQKGLSMKKNPKLR